MPKPYSSLGIWGLTGCMIGCHSSRRIKEDRGMGKCCKYWGWLVGWLVGDVGWETMRYLSVSDGMRLGESGTAMTAEAYRYLGRHLQRYRQARGRCTHYSTCLHPLIYRITEATGISCMVYSVSVLHRTYLYLVNLFNAAWKLMTT